MTAAAIAAAVAERRGEPVVAEPVPGGSCNGTWRIGLPHGASLFCKQNSAPKFPQLLSLERDGLKLIGATQLIRTPAVTDLWESAGQQYLLLEWIEEAEPGAGFWEDFGRRLAALHQVPGDRFGGVPDNYMGTVLQSNAAHDNWTAFFIRERLLPVTRRCLDKGLLAPQTLRRLEGLAPPLDDLFAGAQPCLVHGDLWNGNSLCTAGGPVLIDPAAYWGERSVDLAMTTLFGGFNERFYAAYHEAYPLPPRYREQWELTNLYPLLVHLFLFGSSYYPAIERALRRFA
ncbi:MAG: hypothetical protein EOO12_15540 [Chitinophagaceae bacterium]|nr:MAG: hypothetical protein EOO12_15540 [Chitinophagaceae bacterium]